jgi:hypothetical protein
VEVTGIAVARELALIQEVLVVGTTLELLPLQVPREVGITTVLEVPQEVTARAEAVVLDLAQEVAQDQVLLAQEATKI